MTRQHAPVPSNVHYRRSEWRELHRADPGYHEPRPLSPSDAWDMVKLIPAAVVLVAAIGAFALLMVAFTAPVP